MPETALEWVHAFMTILLKYRTVMGLGELGQDLVTVARELRALAGAADRSEARHRRRRDARGRAAAPRDARLLGGLRALGVAVGAVLVNALTRPGCARCRRIAAASGARWPRCDGTPPRRPREAALSSKLGRRAAAPRPRRARGVAPDVDSKQWGPPSTVRAVPQRRDPLRSVRAPLRSVRAPRAASAAKFPARAPRRGPARSLARAPSVWLIAADAPLDRYAGDAIDARLADLDWVSRCAVAHDAVVEHLARQHPVIPMKLFTLFSSDERALAHVARTRRRSSGCSRAWPTARNGGCACSSTSGARWRRGPRR